MVTVAPGTGLLRPCLDQHIPGVSRAGPDLPGVVEHDVRARRVEIANPPRLPCTMFGQDREHTGVVNVRILQRRR
jgi:hypothetical protein